MNVKPAAAFAAGLWIGAVVAAAIGVFDLRFWERVRPGGTAQATAEQAVQNGELQYLRQEQARSTAEMQRLRETVAELKSNLDARTALEARPQVRRVPFLSQSAPEDLTDAWIAGAVAGGDTASLPRLEALANENSEAALEALAWMADRDGGAALTRAWNSNSLSFANKVKATRYIAATLEANPRAVELLQGLFSSASTDVRLLYAAVDGVASPGMANNPSAIPGLSPPPQSRPAFDLRVQLLDTLTASVTDGRLRQHVEQARDDLLTRWAQAEPSLQ